MHVLEEEFLHFFELVIVADEDVIVLVVQLILDSLARFYIFELTKEVEGVLG
jgi:hypothetical protein